MDSDVRRRPHSRSAAPLGGGTLRRSSPLQSPSVHFTEFSNFANPAPRGQSSSARAEEVEVLGDCLSPVKLREITGKEDLSQVTQLELSIDSQRTSLGNFGRSVPRLQELRVGGVVRCVRDLGTALGAVRVLWLPHCHLRDLDGLPALTALQELYIAFNEVSDVSTVAMVPHLAVLDIESNNLSEEEQLAYLSLCPSLSSLSLEGNPLATSVAQREGGQAGYRTVVMKSIPHLKKLDDVPTAPHTPHTLTPHTNTSSPVYTGTVYTPTHSTPPSSNFGLRGCVQGKEGTQGRRKSEGAPFSPKEEEASPLPARPGTAASLSPVRSISLSSPTEDDSSELTHGLNQVICGNPVRGLRARRRRGLYSQSTSALLRPPTPPSTPPPALPLSLSPPPTSPPPLPSLLEEEVTVTRATSEENLEQQPDHLSPPHSSHPHSSHPHSTHPHPPPRPKSVADFRQRRYKRASPTITRSPSHSPSSLGHHHT